MRLFGPLIILDNNPWTALLMDKRTPKDSLVGIEASDNSSSFNPTLEGTAAMGKAFPGYLVFWGQHSVRYLKPW